MSILKTSSTIFLLFTVLFLQAQDTILLRNPSFEDYARHSYTPKGWYDCGFEGESPPDTHPAASGGEFKVTLSPQDGNTYLGLVVRDNETWESVGQRLKQPLRAGQCYQFSISMARSILYRSASRMTGETVNYAVPSTIRIWGGDRYCAKKQLLGQSEEIVNTDWQTYTFAFQPMEDHHFILLEAYYRAPILQPYNGNVLLDNASAITLLACEDIDIEHLSTPKVSEAVAGARSPNTTEENYEVDYPPSKALSVKEQREQDEAAAQNVIRIFLERGDDVNTLKRIIQMKIDKMNIQPSDDIHLSVILPLGEIKVIWQKRIKKIMKESKKSYNNYTFKVYTD
ncbi:MAG: hypothetical protein AAGI23_18680 [Bacteroidota bacterium]